MPHTEEPHLFLQPRRSQGCGPGCCAGTSVCTSHPCRAKKAGQWNPAIAVPWPATRPMSDGRSQSAHTRYQPVCLCMASASATNGEYQSVVGVLATFGQVHSLLHGAAPPMEDAQGLGAWFGAWVSAALLHGCSARVKGPLILSVIAGLAEIRHPGLHCAWSLPYGGPVLTPFYTAPLRPAAARAGSHVGKQLIQRVVPCTSHCGNSWSCSWGGLCRLQVCMGCRRGRGRCTIRISVIGGAAGSWCGPGRQWIGCLKTHAGSWRAAGPQVPIPAAGQQAEGRAGPASSEDQGCTGSSGSSTSQR